MTCPPCGHTAQVFGEDRLKHRTDTKHAPHSWHGPWDPWVIFPGFLLWTFLPCSCALTIPPGNPPVRLLRSVPAGALTMLVGWGLAFSTARKGPKPDSQSKVKRPFLPGPCSGPQVTTTAATTCSFRSQRNDIPVCLPRAGDPVRHTRDLHSTCRSAQMFPGPCHWSRVELGRPRLHDSPCSPCTRATRHNAASGGRDLGHRATLEGHVARATPVF